MITPTTRVRALVLLLCLAALQWHVYAESSAPRIADHACAFCQSGGWAVVTDAPVLAGSLPWTPLDVSDSRERASSRPIEFSAPRAPPAA